MNFIYFQAIYSIDIDNVSSLIFHEKIYQSYSPSSNKRYKKLENPAKAYKNYDNVQV